MTSHSNTQSELPLVRHLDGFSRLKRCAQDISASIHKEIHVLSKISLLYPALPYLQLQADSIERVLLHIEELWDRSFSEIYALKPESCARIVQDVVACYEHNALCSSLEAAVVDDLAWL
jgi:hypothetical protein